MPLACCFRSTGRRRSAAPPSKSSGLGPLGRGPPHLRGPDYGGLSPLERKDKIVHSQPMQIASETTREPRISAVSLLAGLRPVWFTELALSLYLPAGPSLDQSYHHALLKNLHRDYERTGSAVEQNALGRELKAVQQFLDEHPQGGKPLAIFSCAPAGFFEVRRLPGDVRAQLWTDHSLHLEPLLEAFVAYPPALLVGVDKERARVFRLVLDETEELADMRGESIHRQQQGGWAQSRFQHHEDLHADWNIRRIVRWIVRLAPLSLSCIAVAGPPEARASFIHQLPERLRKAVMELSAPLYLESPSLAEHLRDAYLRVRAAENRGRVAR
jgi:Bacterial archaeo-eukaryotic release factor family 10